MNADRNQPGNQRPQEAPSSAGGFVDAQPAASITAPTSAPIGPASSTPVARRDLLFGRMAIHNGFIDQVDLDNALSQQQADPVKSLADFLVESGSIPEDDRRLIEHLCRRHVEMHGDDPQQSLDSLTMGRSVSFRQPPGAGTVTYSQKSADGKQPERPSSGSFGNYEALREIARGGMGRVLAAHDRTLDREVALKVLLPGANADRFVRESKITARLPHPGIPPVHALGTLDDGSPFLAMKLIVGKTLAEEIKAADHGAPGLLLVFTQVCQAVGFAHSRGVIHRDLKPANIMVGAFGEVQVMDWGLAKDLTSRESAGESRSPVALPLPIAGTDPNRTTDHRAAGESTDDRTQAGTVLGTPSYMAPEQARGEATDVRGDVFALGGILCAILTGQPPFTGNSSLEVIQRAATADLADALARLDGCGGDAELVALCRRCLSPNPMDRPADGQAVADGLTAYLNGVQERLHQAELAEAKAKTKATEQRKRRRVVAVLSVVGVILAVVGSLVALEMRNAARVTGLVDSLASADVAQVPQIVAELENHRGRVTPMLVALASTEPKTAEERKVQLHARLALVPHDEQQVHPLVEELLTANVSYLGVIRDQLAPYEQRFEGDLWELLHSASGGGLRNDADPARRFRAGLALATYATASERWTPADNAFLVEQLVAANPEHQPRLRAYLRPLVTRLLGDLERTFADPKATESHQLSAANAFADYAGSDIPKLSRLLAVATPQQHAVLYPIVAATPVPSAVEDLGKIAATLPPADLGSVERVPFGQRRANAAVTLLRLGQREKVLPVFDMTDDPEALTQFIVRCRERGVGAEALLDCLQRLSDAPQDRYPRHARYALLLALGEFSLDEVPASRREALLRQLADWYRQDPSSGVHGAAGWLLRQWGQAEVARQVDQTAVPYAPDREWFTLAITSPEPPPTTFHYTFIVFPAGDYEIAPVNDEPDRGENEVRHPVKLTRPFALLDREITWAELIAFKPMYAGFRQQTDDNPEAAGAAVDWYDAVDFCRWLGQQSGLSEGDQSYADPEGLDKAQYPREPFPAANWAPRNWPLELGRRGFRLPTETEWEVASRAGTRTAYGFGSEVGLLGQFGWFTENSDKRVHPPRELRPSVRGLFDVHGNLFEWTHDWYGDYGVEAITDPLGAKGGSDRVIRGGTWRYYAVDCRTAFRTSSNPTFRALFIGFRLALSPSGVTPEVAQAEATGGASNVPTTLDSNRKVLSSLSAKLLGKGFKSSWSSDGKQILISTQPSGIDRVDVESGNVTRLVDLGTDPAFSPSGKLVAYVRVNGSLQEETWLVNADGSNDRKLADGGFPCWSRDGRTLYFHSHSDWNIKSVDVTSDERVVKDVMLVNESRYPAVSPDDKNAAYVAGGKLVVVNLATMNRLTHTLPGGNGGLVGWSPDSKQIAFGGYGVADNVGLWLFDVSSGKVKQILAGQFTMPSWSPDGKWLAFDLREANRWEVWAIETKQLETLKEVEAPADLMGPAQQNKDR